MFKKACVFEPKKSSGKNAPKRFHFVVFDRDPCGGFAKKHTQDVFKNSLADTRYFFYNMQRLMLEQMNPIIDPENSLTSAVAELNTYNQKRSRSFSDTYIFEPEATREEPCGKLFVMIEIDENTKKASQVAEAIATIAQFEYYKNQHPGMVANFESALAKVNEVLSEIAEHGEISWVGKIHAVIAALSNHQLAISQTGKVKTYLLRGSEPMEIGDESPTHHTDAVRTFDSIATGELMPHDHLVFTNSGLLNSLALPRIESFLQQNPVLSSARLVESSLDKSGISPACALLIKVDTAKAIAIENSKDEKYADLTPEELSQEAPTKKIQNAFDDIRSRNWAVKIIDALKAAGRGVKVAGAFVAHFGKNIFEGVRGKVHAGKHATDTLSELEEKQEEAMLPKMSTSKQDDPILHKPEPLLDLNIKDRLNKNFSEDTDLGVRPKRKFSVGAVWTTSFSKVKNFPSSVKRMPRVSQVLLITSASLLIIFVVSIGIFSTNKAKDAKAAQFKSMYEQAQNKYNSAKAALIYSNAKDATSLLSEAENLNGQVLGSSYYNAEAKALQDKINQEKYNVEHINDVKDVKEFATVGAEGTKAVALLTDGTKFYAASADNKLYSVSANGGTAKASSMNFPGGGTIIHANYFESGKSLLLLTNKSELAEYSLVDNEMSMVNTLGIESVTDIVSYGTRFVYFLQPSANKILRATKTSAGLTNKVSWIKDANASLSNAVSLAIDGSIYVLNSDGSVKKFLNGGHDDFTTPILKVAMSNPTKIITDADSKNVYILDPANKRIVVTSKTGSLVKELTSENFVNMTDAVFNESKSMGYVLAGNKVYSFPLVLK